MRSATVKTLPTPDAVGAYVADRLLSLIDGARKAGRGFLLGSPTGRTPRPIYAALAQRLGASKQDLSHVTLVMMDEYLVGGAEALRYAPASEAWSCHRFVDVEILGVLNPLLPAERQLRRDRVWFPDVKDPAEFDARIAKAGGMDVFILASGASDGHVAFNSPGSPRNSRSRIVELPEQTRRDSLNTFPAFGTLEKVPRHGITVGVETITAAKEALMVVLGRGKQQTFSRMRATDKYDPSWPATLIHECAHGEIVADAEAAAQ